jgi:hypothetical protein
MDKYNDNFQKWQYRNMIWEDSILCERITRLKTRHNSGVKQDGQS